MSSGIRSAPATFLDWLPALVLALLCLRGAELVAGLPAGAGLATLVHAAGSAVVQDLVAAARFLPGLFLCSLPLLAIGSRRARWCAIGFFWSLLVIVQAALMQYFLTARVPLGADLYAYSWQEIRTTVGGGGGLDAAALVGLALSLAVLWSVLARQSRRAAPMFSPRAAALVLALSLVALVTAPREPGFPAARSEDARNLALNKTAYFLDDSLAWAMPGAWRARPLPEAVADQDGQGPTVNPGFHYLDPEYPFLRAEQTPDVLGPYFDKRAERPPNLVIVIVEGLGRSFSGPGARLGSFTPQLDALAARSLYWENFLAPQGRTFAALSSILAALPFGAEGFAMLGPRMPAHASLPRILKKNGYRLKFYSGTDPDFDNERQFLQRQGMDVLVGRDDFGPEFRRIGYWGYADGDLVTRALSGEARDQSEPYLTVIQTITMHTPYTFPDQARFDRRLEQRLDELGIAQDRRAAYRADRNIYTSILYTDDALGRFFEESRKLPSYPNTIFVVTGDHRLPEIPLATRIDRYHVPLIVFSPLLKAPASIKSVSSQFDLAPSLLAFLAHNYGLETPQAVTWLGSGLDMEPAFRNIHDIPIKQTKTNLVDFVSGTRYLNQDVLYEISDGMSIEPVRDAAALADIRTRFAAFHAANDRFASTLALAPAGTFDRLVAYRAQDRLPPSAAASSAVPALAVREVSAPASATPGQLTVQVVFANASRTASDTFIPLVVLLAADGREISETYGPPRRLAAGESLSLDIAVTSRDAPRGDYFLSVVPSHPDTGKSMGTGRYRIPVRLGG